MCEINVERELKSMAVMATECINGINGVKGANDVRLG